MGLSKYFVKKVAVHSGGRHALALTADGKVYSLVSFLCVGISSCAIHFKVLKVFNLTLTRP